MAAATLTAVQAIFEIGKWIIKGGGDLAKKCAIESAKFLAYRALFLFVFCIVIPILLHNVLSFIILKLMNYSVGYLTDLDTLGIMTIELTSLAAWIGQKIGIHDCVSIYMSAIATRLVVELAKGFWYTTSLPTPNWKGTGY